MRILEEDVVLRITAAEFLLDFCVEIVFLVLRLPKAERHPQFVQQRTVNEATVSRRRVQPIFGNEDQVFQRPQSFKSVLNASLTTELANLARYSPQIRELVDIG